MAEAHPAPNAAPEPQRKTTEFQSLGEALRFMVSWDFIKLALVGEDRWCLFAAARPE